MDRGMERNQQVQVKLSTKARRFLAAIWICTFTGCNVAMPNLQHPGNISQQRLRATYHDPYATPNGAPEFEGARPDQYERPRPWPVQSQWYN